MTESPDSPMSQHQPWVLVPRGIDGKKGREANRWHLLFPSWLFHRSGIRCPQIPSQGHHMPTCPHPSPSRRPQRGGAPASGGCMWLEASVQNASVGSMSGSAWPEARIQVSPTSFFTTCLPQAQFLSVVVFPHFPKVNSSQFKEKSETKSSVVSATSSFWFSAIFLFSVSPPPRSPRGCSVSTYWQVPRGHDLSIWRPESPMVT